MNSLGTSSKWPSYDSLPSTSSFLLSESEQTEDEADVFSEGEGDGGMRKPFSEDEGITLAPRKYLDFPAHSDQLLSRPQSERTERSANKNSLPGSASSHGAATICSSAATPGDIAFAQKCADLRQYIHPLIELLHGLKTGRFDKGLSSFQQSVAIDRLQKILGILQRPEMGEKYLHNLLQIEMMLKIWFPQVAFQSADPPTQTNTPRVTQHWCQNQLHMPVKKRKLSWSDPDHSGVLPNNKHKLHHHHYHHHHHHHQPHHQWSWQAVATQHDTVSTCRPGSPKKQKTPEEEHEAAAAAAGGRHFTDVTLSRPPSFSCGRRRRRPEVSPSPAAQDSAVSSSDTVTSTNSPQLL